MDRSGPPPAFVHKLWNAAMPIGSHIVHGSVPSTWQKCVVVTETVWSASCEICATGFLVSVLFGE